MKIQFGAIVTDGRNKIGGHVASKNKAGNYLRTRVTPTNPNSTAQQSVRNQLTQISQAWRSLTEAQRAGWQAAAISFPYTDVFGNSKQYSGSNLFSKLNGNLLNVGETLMEDAPSPSTTDTFLTMSGAYVSGVSLELTYTLESGADDSAVVILATPALSAGRAFSKSYQRQIITGGLFGVSPVSIYAAYVARFGEIPSGKIAYVSGFFVNKVTGQVSGMITCKITSA